MIVLPLRLPVKVYSGIAPPQALLDAMAAGGRPISIKPLPAEPVNNAGDRPPMPPRPSGSGIPTSVEDAYDEAPPSYEDAMAETLSPVDGPRREYNPPDAPSANRANESGADSTSSVFRTKGLETTSPYGHPEANSSLESFDMLPATPPESHSGSPPTSPIAHQQSVLKIHKALPLEEESPPQYQQVAGPSSPNPQDHNEHGSSRPGFRPMNLGVPNRKPVPRSPSSGHF